MTDTPDSPTPYNGPWLPIETAPTDNTRFWVGGWFGKAIVDEDDDYIQIAWHGEPEWIEVITHNEEFSSEYQSRGWQHRNGPFGGMNKPQYWRPKDISNPPPHGIPVIPKRTNSKGAGADHWLPVAIEEHDNTHGRALDERHWTNQARVVVSPPSETTPFT